MKFEVASVDEAEGAILGHDVAGDGGRRLFRKGRSLTTDDVERLRSRIE